MRKLILSLFIIVASLCCAQNRLCRLHVVDDATGDALPCVHAVVNGSLLGVSNADTTPIQRQISCNNQNDKKSRVNTNIYSI